MPSLFRFLVVAGIMGAVVFGGLYVDVRVLRARAEGDSHARAGRQGAPLAAAALYAPARSANAHARRPTHLRDLGGPAGSRRRRLPPCAGGRAGQLEPLQAELRASRRASPAPQRGRHARARRSRCGSAIASVSRQPAAGSVDLARAAARSSGASWRPSWRPMRRACRWSCGAGSTSRRSRSCWRASSCRRARRRCISCGGACCCRRRRRPRARPTPSTSWRCAWRRSTAPACSTTWRRCWARTVPRPHRADAARQARDRPRPARGRLPGDRRAGGTELRACPAA